MTAPHASELLPSHGGDLARARQRYGEPEQGWLDLSTGINPRPYPVPTLDPADLARLPDRDGLADLRAVARQAYGVPPGVSLIATPGSEIALRLLPFVAPAGAVAVVGPTYGSHSEAWRAAGRTATEVAGIDAVPAEVAVAVLANPNNPDGRVLSPDRLAGLARRLAAAGGLLVVDEAFADLSPEASLAPILDRTPALILRSFGKFFGLAGLRLGFVAGQAPAVERLGAMLGDWPVAGPAISIGTAALADIAWQRETRARLARNAKALRQLLLLHGFGIAGGTDLFLLAEHAQAPRIHAGLAERGIWTRAFDYRNDWLRFGLPPDAPALARLDAALAGIMAPATTK